MASILTSLFVGVFCVFQHDSGLLYLCVSTDLLQSCNCVVLLMKNLFIEKNKRKPGVR